MNVFRQIKEKKMINSKIQDKTELKQNINTSSLTHKNPKIANVNSYSNIDNKITIKSNIPIKKEIGNIKASIITISNDLNIKAKITNKNILISENKNTKETLVAGLIKNKESPNKAELHTYQIKTRTPALPNFDDLPLNNNTSLSKNQSQQLDPNTKDMFVDILKKNKLTFGTKQMMDNDLIHAKEAIESGIYITWTD